MCTAVQDILHRIDQLSEAERRELDEALVDREEAEWQDLVNNARAEARARGIDQTAIDRAISELRAGS